jgi:hypothetical protein
MVNVPLFKLNTHSCDGMEQGTKLREGLSTPPILL